MQGSKSNLKRFLFLPPTVTLLFLSFGVTWAQTVTVTSGTTYQTISGFGASSQWDNTFSSSLADIFWKDDSSQPPADQINGNVGLSILRLGIDDSGNADWGTQCAFATQALGINANVRVFGSPWSPPAKWKNNNSVDGNNTGSDNFNPGTNTDQLNTADYADYASYLTSFATACKNTYGFTPYAISVQNEPDYDPSYDACLWSPSAIDTFVGTYLGPDLKNAGFSDIVMLPESFADNLTGSNTAMADSTAAAFVRVIGMHLYGGGPNTIPASYSTTAGHTVESWCTETSEKTSDNNIDSGIFYAGELHSCIVDHNFNAYCYWWLVNINSDDEGLCTSAGTPTPRLYCIGNYSKFIRPGYVRIGATEVPSAGVSVSAYYSASAGKVVIVAINGNTGSSENETFKYSDLNVSTVYPWITSSSLNLVQQTSVAVNGGSFTYTLPAESVVSFVASVSSGSTPTPTNTAAPTATATRTNTQTSTPTFTASSTPTSSPTATKTNSPTSTKTSSPTPSATSSFSPTATKTASSTPSNTITNTATASSTPTLSSTTTRTNTATSTSTPSPTITNTPIYTMTSTPSNTTTGTATETRTSTTTFTATNTGTTTPTLTSTNSSTVTPSVTQTNTATITLTSTSSNTQTGTVTATSTNTLLNTVTSTCTNTVSTTPTVTITNSATATPSVTQTYTPAYTMTSTPTNTQTGTATATSTNTPSNTDTSTSTSTVTATATLTRTYSPTSTSTNTSSITATKTTTSTATDTMTNTATLTATATSTYTRVDTFTNTVTFTTTSTLTKTTTPSATATPTNTHMETETPTATPTSNKGVVIYPNPVTGPTVNLLPPAYPGDSNVQVEIFTIAFRLVKDEILWNVPSGKAVTLELTDKWGTPLANGVYYVVVIVDGHQSIGKLLVIR